MGVSRLQDDLLQAFHEEKKLIMEQLELFDPLAVSLRKPAAQRLLHKGLLIFYETCCYLLAAGTALSIAFMNRISPLYLLQVLKSRNQFTDALGVSPLTNLQLTVAGLLGLIALLFFALARVIRRIRLKNDILNLAGKHIKTLVGQHLKRKASMDAIQQRHFQEWPSGNPATPGSDAWQVEDNLGGEPQA